MYLNAKSSHPYSQKSGIATVFALRLRRICSNEDDFRENSKEYCRYLIDCGHDSKRVSKVFKEIGQITREEARKSKKKRE